MPRFVISYDLEDTHPDPHSELLKHAEAFGWSVWIYAPATSTWYRLPNTTLLGEFPSRESAKQAFDGAVETTRASIGKCKVTKYFVAGYDGATFNSDETSK